MLCDRASRGHSASKNSVAVQGVSFVWRPFLPTELLTSTMASTRISFVSNVIITVLRYLFYKMHYTKVFDNRVLFTYYRITLFFSSRRFLLGNLNTNISETPRTSHSIDEIPLSSLPEPSTTPRRERSSSMSGKKSWLASLPRTLFSCCFSECCMLFVMLMCQGLDIFSPV